MNRPLPPVLRVLRSLAAAPGYALAAVLTLALGIGAATSIYSVVDALLLRPLPYADAGRLVALWSHPTGPSGDPSAEGSPSYPDFQDWAAALVGPGRPFAGLGFARSEGLLLRTPEGAVAVNAAAVSPGFFETLGGRAVLGRVFRADEERPGAARTVVLGHRFWRQHFGADPGVVGRTVPFGDTPVTVVGVMPAGYEYPGRWADVWTPLAPAASVEPAVRERLGQRGLRSDARVVARLAPGATREGAAAALEAVSRRLAAAHPAEDGRWGAHPVPLREQLTGPVRDQLVVLSGAVALLLLVACADVANLSLVRASARGPELALRRALGATPARLARDLFAESAAVAAAGGALGGLLAAVGVRALRAAAPPPGSGSSVPSFDGVAVDGRVLAFAVAVAALTAVLFGVAPALQAARTRAAAALRGGARGAARAGAGRRFRSAVAAGQLAVTLVLLVGAALLGRSFLAARARDPGFAVTRLAAVRVTPPPARYATPAALTALYARLRDAAAQVPGVRAAGVVNHLALTGAGAVTPVRAGALPDSAFAFLRVVDGGYFAASGIPLRRGRAITDADAAAAGGSDAVPVVLSETLARRAFGPGDALGRSLTVIRQAPGRSDFQTPVRAVVVGVAGEVPVGALEETPGDLPAVYLPMSANAWRWATVVVGAAPGVDAAALVTPVRRALAAVDPDVSLADATAGAGLVAAALAERRFLAGLTLAFGASALVLAAVGLYGVVAYGAAQRAPELGVRAALGAGPAALARLTLGEGARLAAAGLGAGALLALWTSRALESVVYGVTARDAPTYAAVAVVLAAVTLAACWAPARRAARTDPITVLRAD